jgi:hypothetical protein
MKHLHFLTLVEVTQDREKRLSQILSPTSTGILLLRVIVL